MNWFAYRLPGENEVRTGKADCLSADLGADGFIAATFENRRDELQLIPAEAPIGEEEDWNSLCDYSETNPDFRPPSESTTPQQHERAVRRILASISSGELMKCVTARAISQAGEVDLKQTFHRLCSLYPSAFIFCFHTHTGGTWMGASPELLLKCDGTEISTCSLAGTRPSGCAGEWDRKNINEQRLVTEYITSKLQERGCSPRTHGPYTYDAGPVCHLRTDIWGSLPHDAGSDAAMALAKALSPTPALCGYPTDAALELIASVEGFHRGFYGGFCGPVSDGGRRIYCHVGVRMMSADSSRFCLFSGGGIVEGSEPETEWEETERKATTLNKGIVIKLN